MAKTYAPGDFSFCEDSWEAAALKNAYDAITTEKLCDFLKNNSPPEGKGFMFWNAPELRCLDAHMEPMGHSGGSYGFTMRVMEHIAQNGWDAYVKLRLENIEKKKREEDARKTQRQREEEQERAIQLQWRREQQQRERQQVIDWFNKQGLPVPKEVTERSC
jgi:hypothetical protein